MSHEANLVRKTMVALGWSPLRLAWALQRTALFWIIGLLNTVFLLPENVGTWRHWTGITFIALAAADTAALLTALTQRFRHRERAGTE